MKDTRAVGAGEDTMSHRVVEYLVERCQVTDLYGLYLFFCEAISSGSFEHSENAIECQFSFYK